MQSLNVSYSDIQLFFLKCHQLCHTQGYCDGDLLNERIANFINQHFRKAAGVEYDKILFFHLTRRLNTTADYYLGDNLYNLLTTKNELLNFLNKHEITFMPKRKHVELYYQGKHIPLKCDGYSTNANMAYLRWRLGHGKRGGQDFCFNGFAFKDLLYRNDYARSLKDCPELLTNLADFLEISQLKNDYMSNSKYYCFEYIVPLSEVIFDKRARLRSNLGKIKYLLNSVMQRLYEYEVNGKENIYDSDNPILRLKDTATMSEKYFVRKEEITTEMLINS